MPIVQQLTRYFEYTLFNFIDCLGTHIGRSIDSDETNVRIAPLIFIPTMASYSLMWITKPIGEGEALIQQHTYALKSESSLLRSVQMLPWTGMPDFEGGFVQIM